MSKRKNILDIIRKYVHDDIQAAKLMLEIDSMYKNQWNTESPKVLEKNIIPIVDLDNEIWKPVNIPYWNNLYLVSSFGRLKSIERTVIGKNGYIRLNKQKIVNGNLSSKKYLRFEFMDGEKRMKTTMHKVVALTFIPNPENKIEVNHKDFNKLNNRVSNLEWATGLENTVHYIQNTNLLQEHEVIRIKYLYQNNKYTIPELAHIFQASEESIKRLINGKSYSFYKI